jgi:hypothetical protein
VFRLAAACRTPPLSTITQALGRTENLVWPRTGECPRRGNPCATCRAAYQPFRSSIVSSGERSGTRTKTHLTKTVDRFENVLEESKVGPEPPVEYNQQRGDQDNENQNSQTGVSIT